MSPNPYDIEKDTDEKKKAGVGTDVPGSDDTGRQVQRQENEGGPIPNVDEDEKKAPSE